MARETLIKCDVCGSEDAQGHHVVMDGVAYDIDLCEEHCRPLVELLAKGHMRVATSSNGTPRNLRQLDGLIRNVPEVKREA